MLFTLILLFTRFIHAEKEKPAILQELNWLKDEIKGVDEPWTQVQEYIDAAIEGMDWFSPKTPPYQRNVPIEEGSLVWWYDAENQWWFTGSVESVLSKTHANVLPSEIPPLREFTERMGVLKKNVRVLSPTLDTNEWRSQKMRDIGEQMKLMGDISVAKELFLASGLLDTANANSYNSLGLHYMQPASRNFTRAKNLLITSHNKQPDWWMPLSSLAYLYYQHGLKADSLRVNMLAWEKNPLNVRVLDQLAYYYQQDGNMKESCFYIFLLDKIKSMNKLAVKNLTNKVRKCADMAKKKEL